MTLLGVGRYSEYRGRVNLPAPNRLDTEGTEAIPMLRGLQLGFGEVLPDALLDQVQALGVQCARVKPGRTAAETETIVRQVAARGMRPLVIVQSIQDIFDIPIDVACDVELDNEPDIGIEHAGQPVHSYEYRARIAEAHAAIWSRRSDGQDIRLWVGSASNFNERGLNWIDSIMPAVRSNVGVSIHWYPHGTDPHGRHPGFSSRLEEVRTFFRIIGARQWAITETGWHTAPMVSGWLFKRATRRTDEQVAAAASQEFTRWAACGASFAVLYQVNDGPTETAGDRYGIRRTDGTLKPVAQIFMRQPAESGGDRW
jgi:hypothetical protein